MQFKNWYWALAAMAVLLVLNTPNACAAGACDTEDFYPTPAPQAHAILRTFTLLTTITTSTATSRIAKLSI
ncbi:MAG: hypothetical protein QW680_01485 [Pyrobaculum sp.]